jgi:hypothetical protein
MRRRLHLTIAIVASAFWQNFSARADPLNVLDPFRLLPTWALQNAGQRIDDELIDLWSTKKADVCPAIPGRFVSFPSKGTVFTGRNSRKTLSQAPSDLKLSAI